MRIVVALIEAILKVLAAFFSASKSQETDAMCDAGSKKEEDDDPKPEFIGLDIPLIQFT